MNKKMIVFKNLWNSLFSTQKLFVGILFLALSTTTAVAQGTDTYDIISTIGKIVDKRSGKELQVGDRVSFQTELEFGSLYDKAILLNSEKAKYSLELPKENLVNSQLSVASNIALVPVHNRSALITAVSRGLFDGLSPKTLREYFGTDAFTIVGSSFTLPILNRDKEKYDLMLRYEIGNSTEEYVSADFTINKSDLKTHGAGISECYVYLKDSDEAIWVTQLALIFVEEENLFAEFDALLKALNHKKEDDRATREVLRHYCADVYGMIDRNTLENTINEFLGK